MDFSWRRLPSSVEKVEGEVLFLQSKITEVLGGSGYNTERLATPYVPQYTGNGLEVLWVTDHFSQVQPRKLSNPPKIGLSIIYIFSSFFHRGSQRCSRVRLICKKKKNI